MAHTKEQLLQYFGSLDISTLDKLQKYSKLLIIPDEDLLVNANMSQMVDKAHSLADSLFPEWTDRSKSDFGEFLIELFAIFSEKDFWYINAFANEGLLKKMRSYSNAFSKASSMGYYPTLCKGAKGEFNITFGAGTSTKYERGDLMVEVNGITFTNDEEFVVPESAAETKIPLTLHQGEHVVVDVVYNGYNLFIRKPNVDIDSITIVMDNVLYTRVKTFGNSAADDTHFVVLPEEDGSCVVYFGSNGFGVQPNLGKSIRVGYRLCNGSKGNLPITSKCRISDSLNSRKATDVSIISPTTGGTDAESLTSIKEKAPLYFRNKRAAVNENIAQEILNDFPFVHKSKVFVEGRDVTYRIIPTSGYLEPTDSDLSTIEEEFYPCLMLGFHGVYLPNTYRSLLFMADSMASKIILDVIILSGYDAATIEASIRQIMDDITNPLVGADYGGSFSKTDVDILMRSRVTGVQSVTFKVQVGDNQQIMPDVHLKETEIFRTIDQEDIIVRTHVV